MKYGIMDKLTSYQTFTIAIVFLIISSCSSALKVFGNETVSRNTEIVSIPFEYSEVKIPLVEVEINSITYKFLVDTGAPTIISYKVFKELQLDGKEFSMMDSQGVEKDQQFVILPEMKLGSLTYKNIGAVVNNLRDGFEFDCAGIDGIIGANQMALSVWKFDYQKKEIQIASNLESFFLEDYNEVVFHPKRPQMTPIIDVNIKGEKIKFTYDTGFSGGIHIKDKKALSSYSNVNFTGTSSIGIYGSGTYEKRKLYKVDSLNLGGLILNNLMIKQESSSLLGNELFENFSSIIDWKTNKIYLKEIMRHDQEGFETFGFSYRLNQLKAIVAYTIDEVDLPFKAGDTIISINQNNFENLNDIQACKYSNQKMDKMLQTMEVVYLKNGVEQKVTLTKQKLLEN